MFLALLVVGVAAATPAPNPSPPAIAYEQIDRLYQSLAVPEPGGFADLETKLLANDVDDDSYPQPAGNAMGSFGNGSFMRHAQRMQNGLVQRFSFLGALARVDDLSTKRATISRPDRGQIIYLDLVARTYRLLEGSDAQKLLQPPSRAAMMQQLQALMPSSQQTGTERIESSAGPTTVLAPKQIDGVMAAGYQRARSMIGVATGTCPPIHTTVSLTEYVDPAYLQPMKSARQLESYSGGSSALAGMTVMGCTYTQGTLPPATDPWQGKLVLYERADVENETPLGTMSATYLAERGNVRALTAADSALFEIPPGFTPAPEAPASPAAVSPTK
jgi:hypothetical protein